MKFVAIKKGMTTNFFSPLSFVTVFGSEIRDPGWVKIRIRDKHPGSATLGSTIFKIFLLGGGRDEARAEAVLLRAHHQSAVRERVLNLLNIFLLLLLFLRACPHAYEAAARLLSFRLQPVAAVRRFFVLKKSDKRRCSPIEAFY